MQALVAGPRALLSSSSIAESLTLVRGAQVRHGCDVLNNSDQPTSDLLRFSTGAVTWSYRPPDAVSGQQAQVSAVRRQADLTVPGSLTADLNSRRLRLWTEWRLLDGSWARWHLGVFVATNPGAVSDDGTLLTRALHLADKSFLWSERKLADPVSVASTEVATAWVKADLTARFGETAFSMPDSTGIVGGSGLTFEGDTSCLEMYSKVLATVGYDQLTADEDGKPASVPQSTIAAKTAEATFGSGQGKMLAAGDLEPLEARTPNVLRFSARQGPSLGNVDGNGLTYRYNTSTGPASIASRGFEVQQTIEVDASDQPTLEAIADAEQQRYFAGGGQRFRGRLALNPRMSDRDVIDLELPRLGITGGSWQVTDWSYPLSPVLSSDADVLMPFAAERRVA